jgi:RimJ/RimL family protein N-acetyltransferase
VTELRGAAVLLRPVSQNDVDQLRRIRYTPDVERWWGQGEADDWPLDDRGHHRLVIDPAAANDVAIRCYTAVGFRTVGVMRAYERDTDSDGWHEGLLMDLLASELT